VVFIPLPYIPLPIVFAVLAISCSQFLCAEAGWSAIKACPQRFAIHAGTPSLVVQAAVALVK
jgi:hypothetical protein